jgi:cobalt-zinc-cadmium resistance protein CzcA
MIEKSVAGAVKNRWLVLFIAVFLAGVGIWSYTRLNIDAYPDISGKQVEIDTTYPGRAAEEVEQEVTMPLERVFSSVPHTEIVRSRTIFGLSVIQINFEPEVDDYWAREVVNQKLSEVQLPPSAQPSMASLSDSCSEIFRYQIIGESPHDQMELRTLQDWVIIPRLLRAKGVVDVANFGGLAKQYTIELDRDKLLKYGVKLQEITSAVQANNSSSGGSILPRGSMDFVIRGLGRITNPKELEDIFIKNSNGTQVFIRDIGHLVISHLPQSGIFGKDADNDTIEGVVLLRRGENPSVVLRNVKEAVAELNETLPKGVRIEPFYDRTVLIQETLHTVLHNTLLGIILVVLVIFFLLGSPRIALIVALTIPGSLLFALILMKLTGIPISLLSIGAIDFGIIVDGAIIVSENILRYLATHDAHGHLSAHSQEAAHSQPAEQCQFPGEEKKAVTIPAILAASKEVQSPMLFSMLIVIVAYGPLLLLSHIEGLLFRPMAITLCFALLGALFIALYLVPVLASVFFRGKTVLHENRLFSTLQCFYNGLLPEMLRMRWKLVWSAFVLLLLTVFVILPRLGMEFLPYMDEGAFWLRVNFPEGISLKENSYYASELRNIIRGFQEVSFVTSQTGRNDLGTDPFPASRMEMMIGLKPRSQWKDYKTKLSLEAALRDRLRNEFPTLRLNLTQPIIDMVTEDANGTSANLAVELVGNDLAKLRELGEQTVALLKKIPGNVGVDIEQEGPQPQLQIRVDRKRAALYQLSADSINNVINTAIGGTPVSQIYEGERVFNIVVKYAPKYVNTPEAIGLLPVFNDQGGVVPLKQVTDIDVVDGQTLIARANNHRCITVRCDIRDRAQGDFVAEAQKRFVSEVKLQPGYSVEWMGMFENLERARKHFTLLIPMTVLIIFVILLLTFRSLAMAAIVLVTLPFSLIGGMLALWFRGMHMTVSTGVGLTSLFGVATMLGVLMVSRINEIRKDKAKSLDDAVAGGAAICFRPIIMTATVAILGLLPASLATGIGSDVQRPIATVIVWGLFSSVFLTLFVLPALYRIVEGATAIALLTKHGLSKPGKDQSNIS